MGLPIAKKVPLSQVPIIDLSAMYDEGAAARRTLAGTIAQACVDLGFFYILNHRLPTTAITGMFSAAKHFFSLPLEDKLEVSISKASHYRGYIPLTTMAQKPTFRAAPAELKGNLYEAFQIHPEFPESDPSVVANKPLHGANQWPSAMPELRDAMLTYYECLHRFCLDILKLFALGLGLPETALHMFFNKPMMQLRLIHYPPQSPNDPGENIGLRPHTDSGAFTVLVQDRVGGLEVLTRGQDWIEVPFLENSCVINLGEMMKIWTDGVFLATPHRVVNRYGYDRYSIPFFMTPDFDARIAPVLHNPDPSEAPSFATTVSREDSRTCGEILVPLYDRIWPTPSGN